MSHTQQRWGLPHLSRTRKENRKQDIRLFNQNLDVLKAAQHLQPAEPVRLTKPLPQWQVDVMRQRLQAAQQELNLRAAGVTAGAGAAALAQQRQRRVRPPRELAGPPVDPQLQQQHNQREVTRIRQEQIKRYQQQQQQQAKQQKQEQQPQASTQQEMQSAQ